MKKSSKIVCVSDTHGQAHKLDLPDGDILLHAGDFSGRGLITEFYQFFEWLTTQEKRYDHVVWICGNHDGFFVEEHGQEWLPKTFGTVPGVYLQESSYNAGGLNVYGVPHTPWFHDWAFNVNKEQAKEIWSKLPETTDVLLTHGPPRSYGDRTLDGELVGCPYLLGAIDRVKPKLAVYGHIHEGYGTYKHGKTRLINASTCTRAYRPTNKPIVVTIKHG